MTDRDEHDRPGEDPTSAGPGAPSWPARPGGYPPPPGGQYPGGPGGPGGYRPPGGPYPGGPGGYPPPPTEGQYPGGPYPGGPGGYPPPPPGDPYASGYPVALPPGLQQDPVSGLVLPVGVELASVGRRIGAWFLAIPLSIVTLFIGYIIWGAIVWGRGQTPALQVLGMRCWRPEEGRVAGWWWMALREIVGRIAEGILGFITELVSFILFLSGREHRSLHDIIAGTVVLHDPDKILG